MDMKQKNRTKDEEASTGTPFASPLKQKETAKEEQKTTERSVYCTHGIHSGNFPVGGMTVAEAREALSGLLNIAKESVCVIGGVVVEDEDITIGENTTMISFVKQASVKGHAQVLTISGKRLAGDGFGIGLDTVSDAVSEAATKGIYDEPLPSGCLWKAESGDAAVYIVQLEPALRRVLFQEDGKKKPTAYRLATPYVILKIPVKNGAVQQSCELFYSNEPVRSVDDGLFFSNLPNVSPNAHGCHAWVCTQFLGKVLLDQYRPGKNGKFSETDQMDALVKHVFDGGFNRSSEHHEGDSCFSKAAKDFKDARVTDMAKWQEASLADPHFIRTISWKRVGVTIRQLIEESLQMIGGGTKIISADQLAGVLLGYAARKGIKVPAGSSERI